MIPLLPGWQRVVRANAVIMRAMDRPVGELRYREVYGPVQPIRRIIEERLALAPLPMSTVVKLHPPERVMTIEGEHAAIVQLDLLCSDAVVRPVGENLAAVPDRPAVRMFGVTFADHFTTLIDGLSLERQYFDEFIAAIRRVTRHTSLVLGERRRRFVYRRPPGWQALATPFTTRYIPPDYPRNLAMITVYPAMPAGPSHWFLESVISDIREKGAVVRQVGEPELVSYGGVTGNRWKVTSTNNGKSLIHVPIVLQDKHYVYRLRLDHGPENLGARPVFDAVCESIERILQPTTAKVASTDFDHWSE